MDFEREPNFPVLPIARNAYEHMENDKAIAAWQQRCSEVRLGNAMTESQNRLEKINNGILDSNLDRANKLSGL